MTDVRVPQLLPGVELPEVGPLEEFYITVAGLPSHEEVMQAASSNAPARKGSIWGLVMGLSGGILMVASGVGFVALGAWMRFAS